jgi:hypothetical protein
MNIRNADDDVVGVQNPSKWGKILGRVSTALHEILLSTN